MGGHDEQAKRDDPQPLFFSWLEERESGRGPSFEEFCARYPAHAEHLRALHAAHGRARLFLEPDAAAELEILREPAALPGTRYELVAELASGGMGTIHSVRDPSLERTIALKVARSAAENPALWLDDRDPEARLLAEARILAQLDHPGVVPVHEVGRDARGRAYFTMKRVEGHDFQVVIDAYHAGDERWRLTSAIAAVKRVCEAIEYAHSRGVIHRDLKPSNIMVGRFGEVYVMDWGLAKCARSFPAARARPEGAALHECARPSGHDESGGAEGPVRPDALGSGLRPPTVDGTVVGTPIYMSPEQARGECAHTDERSDVYSIGALLYHLLAGRAPYSVPGRTLSPAEGVAAVLAGPPASLARLARQAPEELVAVAERALERDPVRRYGSVSELKRELEAWLEGRVVRAHRSGAWAELSKWVRRNRAAAFFALAVLGGLAFAALAEIAHERDLRRANEETRARAEELRRENTLHRLALASVALANGDVSTLGPLLEGCPPDLRGWEWQYLARELDTSAAVFEQGAIDLRCVRLLPDGRTLLVGGGPIPARLRLLDWPSGELRRELTLPEGSFVNTASVSADGRLVSVFERYGSLTLFDTQAWEPVARLDCRLHGWHGAEFAPRGSLLAAYGTEGVELWDAAARARVARLCAQQDDIADVAWSSDGLRLAAASWDGSVSVWSAEGELERVLRDSSHRVQQLEFSPDGRWLAGGNWDSRVLVWDARSLQLVHRSDRLEGQVMALAWSPDAALLVASGGGAVVNVLEAGSWQPVGRLVGHAGSVQSLTFAGAGRTLLGASSLGAVRVWDLASNRWRSSLGEEGREPPAAVQFSTDSGRVAVAFGSGLVETWDLRTRTRVGAQSTGLRLRHLDWSSDGAWFALVDWADGLHLRAADGEGPARTIPLAEPIEAHFDPRAERLAVTAQDSHLRAYDVASLALLWEVAIPSETSGWPGVLFGASWSPDGTELVTSTHDGRIQVRSAASGALLRETVRPGLLFTQRCRDGGHILASGYAGMRGMEMLEATTLSTLWSSGPTSHLWPVLSPDCQRVFSANWRGLLGVWDAASGRIVTEFAALPPGNPRLGVSPDGACVVLAAGDRLAFFDACSRP